MTRYRALSPQGLTLTAIVALTVAAFLALGQPAVMVVNGNRVLSDVAPITTANRRTFVPIRAIADALGARTVLEAKTAQIDVIRAHQSLRLRLGSRHASLNGMPMTLSAAPFRVRGRTMVPLSLVEQAFGVRANYDARRGRIEVLSPGVARAPRRR